MAKEDNGRLRCDIEQERVEMLGVAQLTECEMVCRADNGPPGSGPRTIFGYLFWFPQTVFSSTLIAVLSCPPQPITVPLTISAQRWRSAV